MATMVSAPGHSGLDMIGPASQAGLLDLGDRETWPRAVVALITDVASAFPKGRKQYATDLKYGSDFGESLEADLRGLIGNRPIAFYHATRLLPHEVGRVKAEGLELLTAELRTTKLRSLLDEQLVSVEEADLLERTGPLSWGYGLEGRLNDLSVVAPIGILAGEPDGFCRLLLDWGGESISRAAAKPGRPDESSERIACRTILNRVNSRSVPTVIEVALMLTDLPRRPHLWQVIVGGLIRAHKPWNEWHLKLPARRVVDAIQPGHARWNAAWLRSR